MFPIACDRVHTLAPTTDDVTRIKGGGIDPNYSKDFTAAMGIVPAMVTPMTPAKAIDYDGLRRLVDWHAGHEVSGIFLASGSGEYFLLTENEVVEMASQIIAHVDGGIPVLVGSTNHNECSADLFYEKVNAYNAHPIVASLLGAEAAYDRDVAANIAMAQRVAAEGPDGIFVTTPRFIPYEKFSDWDPFDWITAHGERSGERYERLCADLDDLMVDYYTQVHDAVDVPVWGYELPGQIAGYKFSATAFAQLGALERMIAIKDTTISVAAIQAKVEAALGSIQVLDANVENLPASLQVGASGAINTTSNVAPGLFVQLHRLVSNSDLTTAMALHEQIMIVDHFLMDVGEYPLNAKVAVKSMGVRMGSYTRQNVTSYNLDRIREMIGVIEQATEDFEAPVPTGIMNV